MALPDNIHVSYSQLQTWRRCRRKWYLSYVERLSAAAPSYAFWLGTGVHEALEVYYATKPRDETNLHKAFAEWAAKERPEIEKSIEKLVNKDQILLDLDENYALGMAILDNYAAFAPEHDDFEVIHTEHAFSIPLGITVRIYDPETGKLGNVPVHYDGRIDGIVRLNSNGKLYILEHKTAKNFNEGRLVLDQQSTSYMWAGEEEFGEPISGVYYNILRKQKNGPRVKTPLVYRLQVDRSRASIRDFPEQVRMMVKDMEVATEHGLFYHTPADDCNWCPFYNVCSMIQDEADPQDYIDTYFRRVEEELAEEIAIE